MKASAPASTGMPQRTVRFIPYLRACCSGLPSIFWQVEPPITTSVLPMVHGAQPATASDGSFILESLTLTRSVTSNAGIGVERRRQRAAAAQTPVELGVLGVGVQAAEGVDRALDRSG
jgi:hypothetical protein